MPAMINQTVINQSDHLIELKKRARDAIKENKIYTIRGNFQTVRNALKNRGWIEKIVNNNNNQSKQKNTQHCHYTNEDNKDEIKNIRIPLKLSKIRNRNENNEYLFCFKYERKILSRFIDNAKIDLIWTDRKDKNDYIEQTRNPHMLINKFDRVPFTNKENLNNFLKDLIWYFDAEIADVNFPRCFNIWNIDELNEFIEHFKISACVGFLRLLNDKFIKYGRDAVFSSNGKIPFTSVDFAMKRCFDYVHSCQHNDIDLEETISTKYHICEYDWDLFLKQHYQLTHENYFIQFELTNWTDTIIKSIVNLLTSIAIYWPQYNIDGYENLWILKPANKCRGRGIQITNNLSKILNHFNTTIASKNRYVIQKYIEHPLIIHKTKFDIRQWFLISSIQPLIIWMYKECYLRFSSQEYTLNDYHESIHLTNHAVQKKYNNQSKRDENLPIENMWDSYSFQAYLRQIDQYHLWPERIYPGMRKAIVATMLASQDHMERKPNTFELFGADFMICENYYPWLIEINSNPDLASTTSVTARMCPQCLEDVIKVIVDRRQDTKANIGNFELIYRQIIPSIPAYMGLNLCVKGNRFLNDTHYYSNRRKTQSIMKSNNICRQRTNMSISSISQINKPMSAFNDTEQMQHCLNLPNTNTKENSRTSSEPNLYLNKNTEYLNKIQNLKSQIQCQPIQKSNQILVNTTKNSLNINKLSIARRHRSCGPQLTVLIPDTQIKTQLESSILKCNRYLSSIKHSKNTNTNTNLLPFNLENCFNLRDFSNSNQNLPILHLPMNKNKIFTSTINLRQLNGKRLQHFNIKHFEKRKNHDEHNKNNKINLLSIHGIGHNNDKF